MSTADDLRLRGHWVERRLKNGMLIPCWVPPMPRIPDRYLECVFYLYPSLTAAEVGEGIGGCGFFLTVPFERTKQNHLYAITNKHIIDDGSLTLRITTKDKGTLPVDSDDRRWFYHPGGDDLAILLIDFPIKFECTAINLENSVFVTKELINERDLGVGEEVFAVGRFVSHDGKQKNEPVARFGNISQMPGELIKQDNGHMQESYLVESRSIGGYSGAPVFMYIPPWAVRPGKEQVESRQYGPWFLGINWGHLNEWRPVCNAAGKPIGPPFTQVSQNSGMMAVIPAWKLMGMINHPKAIASRRAREDEVLGKGPPVASSDVARGPASAEATNPDENPAHREDFTALVREAAKLKPKGGQT